jgi:hypothetical protein
MQVEGYKDDDGNLKVMTGTWPKFEIGLNPVYFAGGLAIKKLKFEET